MARIIINRILSLSHSLSSVFIWVADCKRRKNEAGELNFSCFFSLAHHFSLHTANSIWAFIQPCFIRKVLFAYFSNHSMLTRHYILALVDFVKAWHWMSPCRWKVSSCRTCYRWSGFHHHLCSTPWSVCLPMRILSNLLSSGLLAGLFDVISNWRDFDYGLILPNLMAILPSFHME